MLAFVVCSGNLRERRTAWWAREGYKNSGFSKTYLVPLAKYMARRRPPPLLGAIGIKTYSDLSNQVHKANTEIERQVLKMQTEIGARLALQL
jgi:hypothetical protein